VETVPIREIERRIREFQGKLAEKEVDIAIIAQNVDLYYFTGSCQSGYLAVPSRGEPIYLVNKSFKRARKESPLPDIRHLLKFRTLPQILEEEIPNIEKLGLELDVLPTSFYLRFQNMFPQAEIIDISGAIRELRLIKSPYEIDIFRKGAEISRQMLEAVPRFLKEGKTEVEFAAELECFMRKRGHQGGIRLRQFNQEVFYGHVMSGENLTYPSFFDSPTGGPGLSPAYPQGPGWKKIGRDEIVIVDYVVAYQGYCVDCTRFYSLGSVPSLLKEAHAAALTIQEEIMKTAGPGTICSDIYRQACQIAEDFGLRDHFMGYGTDQATFVAHGVGLELDELPVMADRQDYPLQTGMVFALEPKMVIPGVGVAGVENTILVTEQGLEKITILPEEIIPV